MGQFPILVDTGDMSTLGKVESCLCFSPSVVRWLKTRSGKSWWWPSAQEGAMEPGEMLQQLALQTIKSSWRRPSGPASPSTESHHLSPCLLDTHGMGTPPLPGALHEEILPNICSKPPRVQAETFSLLFSFSPISVRLLGDPAAGQRPGQRPAGVWGGRGGGQQVLRRGERNRRRLAQAAPGQRGNNTHSQQHSKLYGKR